MDYCERLLSRGLQCRELALATNVSDVAECYREAADSFEKAAEMYKKGDIPSLRFNLGIAFSFITYARIEKNHAKVDESLAQIRGNLIDISLRLAN